MKCQECESDVNKLGLHWYHSGHYPTLSEYDMDLIVGLLLGDGSVRIGTQNMALTNTNKSFLDWVSNEIGILHSSTKRYDKPDRHVLHTRSHPFIGDLRDWYGEEGKRYPDDLSLTPIMARMWYCGDGGLDGRKRRPQIACANESDRVDFLKSLFNNIGFHPTWSSYRISIPHREAMDFLNWMGEPPPGMEYKWGLDP